MTGERESARIDLNVGASGSGAKKRAEFSSRALTNFMSDTFCRFRKSGKAGLGNRDGKPAYSRETQKNGRELANVMDLDEVYYDARAYAGAVIVATVRCW